MTRALLALSVLWLLPVVAHGQVADPKFAFAKPEEVKTVVWKASAQAGLLNTAGNANGLTISGGFNASRDDGSNKLVLDLAGAYGFTDLMVINDGYAPGKVVGAFDPNLDPSGEYRKNPGAMILDSQRKTTTGFFLGKFRYDRFFTKNNSGYATVFAGLDQPGGKELMTGGQLGYARQLLKTKMHELAAELGYDITYTSFITPVDSYTLLHSIRAFAGYILTIAESTTIAASVEALINMNSATVGAKELGAAEASRVNGKVALNTKLWKSLSLRASFALRYDAAPPVRALPAGYTYAPGFYLYNKPWDTLTEVALVVNFL